MKRAVAIFHRHGHRAPSRAIWPKAEEVAKETTTWQEMIHDYSKPIDPLFSIINHQADPPKDTTCSPYGCLTSKGLDHIRDQGAAIAKQFNLSSDDISNIKLYSTNYTRTQLSGQGFVQGLGFTPAHGTIELTVRPADTCAMAFYDGYPDFFKALFARSLKSNHFRAFDSEEDVLEAKSALLERFPSLLMENERFDWSNAFDYFVCRRAHGMEVLQDLQVAEEVITRRFSDRFAMYMRDGRHLAAVGVPLLEDLMSALIGKVQEGSNTQTQAETETPDESDMMSMTTDLTVFSGHDINLFALLFSLGAEVSYPFCYKDVRSDDLSRHTPYQDGYWPGYGSTLVFEAHNIQHAATSKRDVYVGVFLNGKPLDVNLKIPQYVIENASGDDFSYSAVTEGLLQFRGSNTSNLISLAEIDALIDAMKQGNQGNQ
jgi:hypothetical protein